MIEKIWFYPTPHLIREKRKISSMVWKNGVSPVHLRAKKMAMMMNEARKTRVSMVEKVED
jgi:hypothetical protein